MLKWLLVEKIIICWKCTDLVAEYLEYGGDTDYDILSLLGVFKIDKIQLLTDVGNMIVLIQ